MKAKNVAIAVVAMTMSSSLAFAKGAIMSGTTNRVAKASTLAGDVNVVNPGPSPSPAPSAPPSTTTVVTPAAAQPVQVQPIVAPPGSQKVVHEDVEAPHNYMATIALSALMGAVAGVLVGGAIYYLGNDQRVRDIGFWTAGGVLVGTGVGITQVMVQENRANRAIGFADPVPTYRLALLNLRF